MHKICTKDADPGLLYRPQNHFKCLIRAKNKLCVLILLSVIILLQLSPLPLYVKIRDPTFTPAKHTNERFSAQLLSSLTELVTQLRYWCKVCGE